MGKWCRYDNFLVKRFSKDRRDRNLYIHEENEKTLDKNTDISNLLNALDGVLSVDVRILIATTNYIDTLDDALLRPGRIDLKVDIGYINNESFLQFVNNFFPDSKLDLRNIRIKQNISGAMLQEMLLKGDSLEKIIYNISLLENVQYNIENM